MVSIAYIAYTNFIQDTERTYFQIQDTHSYEQNNELKRRLMFMLVNFHMCGNRLVYIYGLTSRFQQLQISEVFTLSIQSVVPYTTLFINAKKKSNYVKCGETGEIVLPSPRPIDGKLLTQDTSYNILEIMWCRHRWKTNIPFSSNRRKEYFLTLLLLIICTIFT